MSYFDEIKGLFTTEITNSAQYALGIKIKDLLKADIIAPNIDFKFIYNLSDSDYIDINNKEQEEQILIFCLKLILGIDIEIINKMVIIPLNKFLN